MNEISTAVQESLCHDEVIIGLGLCRSREFVTIV